jgi:hypothetical protein
MVGKEDSEWMVLQDENDRLHEELARLRADKSDWLPSVEMTMMALDFHANPLWHWEYDDEHTD